MRIVLFRGSGIIAKLIRWQTRSRWAHAAILLNDGRTLIEAMPSGVRSRYIWPAELAAEDAFEIIGLTEQGSLAAEAFAKAQVNKGYDFWAIIRFIDRARMPDNDRWFCSELAFEAILHGGVRLLDRIEPSAVSPELLGISPFLK